MHADIKTKLIYEKYIHVLFASYGWGFKGQGVIPQTEELLKGEIIKSNTAWFEEIKYTSGEFFYK